MNSFSLFDFVDYRELLDAYYKQRKAAEPHFSHRAFAQRAGFNSSGYFRNVISGAHRLGPSYVEKFVKGMGLQGAEADYFRALVDYCHSVDPTEKQQHFERMLSVTPRRTRRLLRHQMAFYSSWHHTAVHQALRVMNISDNLRDLARFVQPTLPLETVRASMKLLEELALIRKDPQGCWRPVDGVVIGGAELKIGIGAQDRFDPSERFITTQTFTSSRATAHLVHERLREFRRVVIGLVEGDHQEEQVYQLNFQLFPLSSPREA